MNNYINERMAGWAMNIADFNIGETILDKDGCECEILNKTTNTIEVFGKKKTNKGINCSDWFDMVSFNKRFIKKNRPI